MALTKFVMFISQNTVVANRMTRFHIPFFEMFYPYYQTWDELWVK